MASVTSNNRYRIEQLEKKYCELDTKIDLIMTNHLPHLNSKIEKLNTDLLLKMGDIQKDIASTKVRVNLLAGMNLLAIVIAAILAKVLS